jgi:hypothetical protein
MVKNMKRKIKKMNTRSLPKSRKLVNKRYKSDSNIPTKTKTFYLKYDKELSVVDKMLLNTFQQKYLYHAIDDILYFSKSKSVKQDNLLALVYSTVLSLQNNFAIDFFDIWIDEIYITRAPKHNKFLAKDNSILEPFSFITLKLFYTYKSPKKKPESFW